ncbi:toll/interleukin-1 receptor domain-containing protein [Streptomyces avermitilis]|uniref:toll/interleukin-1 receptor domain-containing protein n=1 Tax=Streptomyces avermitilis TaxID=33903 RepID=UPI0033C454F8
MEGANLAIALVGLIATVASTYFAWVPLRNRGGLGRRAGRDPGPGPAPRPTPAPPQAQTQTQGPYDVFVSYADAEAEAAERLADRLREAGASVFLVRWVEPGLIPLLETERALVGATLGVLLFGPGTMADSRIREEYAALLQRVHAGGFRFVPARAGSVELPPFADIRRPVDLREPGTPRYDGEVTRLADTVLRLRRRTDA